MRKRSLAPTFLHAPACMQKVRSAAGAVLLLIALFFTLLLSAQSTHTVKGKVTNQKGEPLEGASVTAKGANTGTSTDASGNYTLQVANAQSTLVFSNVGYADKEVAVNGQSSIDVQLQQGTADLGEVVVVGYGSQRKRDLTGAVAVVETGEVTKRQATTIGEALQGLASGVFVRGGGQPGSEARVEIRGLKNLTGTNPLYVIDGMITYANRDFNPNDVESIQILKDASAAAIYGSRAANGVIIITTKKGKKGPMRVDFAAKTSIQTTPRWDLAGKDEFVRLNYMAYDNANVPRQNLNLDVTTDWQDESFQTGYMQDYNVSFAGGGDNGSYMVSANYFKNKGAVISTGFDRISLRVNSQGSKGIFSFGENLAISNAKSDEMSGNPYADVVRLLPTIPVYDPANPGGYGYGSESRARTFGTNPVAIADLEDRALENFRVRGNIWGELKLLPFLKYRANFGYETSADNYRYKRKEGNWTLNQAYDPAIFNENRARYQSMLVENTLSFNKRFGKHSVNAIAGQTYQRDNYGQIWGTKRNILQNSSSGSYYWVLDQGSEPQVGGYDQKAILLSYLGRIEYNFADKYLLNAVVRHDGSSRLGRNEQWGTFPSVSAAWRVSNEEFFKVNFVNDLKLRISHGTLGSSSNLGYWDYLPVINTFSTIAMGTGQNVLPGATQVRLANQDLRWEKLTQTNFGVDASLLNSKLSVTAEYFIAKTTDVLTYMPILMTTGNDGGNPAVNAASLRNTGFELSATYRAEAKDFSYYVTANVTTLRNKILNLGYGRNDIFTGTTVTKLGSPAAMWFLLQTDGLFQTQEEVTNYKNKDGITIQPNARPGDLRFVDHNGDGQITNDDKIVLGSPWAKWELGLNMGASYKNFDLTMNWFGSFGSTVYNGYRSLVDRFDDNSNYREGIQPWTPDNTNTNVPRAFYGSTLNSRGDSDRWLESGTFMRLKFVSLSYRLPDALIKRIGFANAQITISGQNLLTFSSFGGLDPEFNNGNMFERGVYGFQFPNLKMYSAGLQFGF
ncbi:TonB-dependent receptor [Terrimonas sp. NA20]|uniref:TonB-dependent receptor n=1 Tax=Terrimonas ginsenosidimutans TaxID=2908004 RepID=A0ABS9KP19_9BACT|nr:TonB-dependent receptor [Terrimonas ginsenosidimutans]MCG2614068.1 TonB-dependent receptor [Terrimonas ginsenosidimutans]